MGNAFYRLWKFEFQQKLYCQCPGNCDDPGMTSCPQCDKSKTQPYYNSIQDCLPACNLKACKGRNCNPQHPASGASPQCAHSLGDIIDTAFDDMLLFFGNGVLILGACAVAGVLKALHSKTNVPANMFTSLLPILVCGSLGVFFCGTLIAHKGCPTRTTLPVPLLRRHMRYARN